MRFRTFDLAQTETVHPAGSSLNLQALCDLQLD